MDSGSVVMHESTKMIIIKMWIHESKVIIFKNLFFLDTNYLCKKILNFTLIVWSLTNCNSIFAKAIFEDRVFNSRIV